MSISYFCWALKMLGSLAFLLFLGTSCWAEVRVTCVGKGKPECKATGKIELPNLQQGDMVIRPKNFSETGFGRNAISDGARLWPNKEIPFVFHEDYTADEQMAVFDAMNFLMSQTCVKFVPWTGVGPVTIITKQDEGCYAVVGYALDEFGYAYVNYQNPGCLWPRGLVEHEFLHLIGLFHEQSRPDRDNYVTVFWDNIEKEPEDMSHNFEKQSEDDVTTFGLPYDYMSVMHYENFDFSINPNIPTIVHKYDPTLKLGQRVSSTPIDLEKVRRMYNC